MGISEGGESAFKKKDHTLESDFTLESGQEDVVCVDLEGEWSEQSKIFPHPSFKNAAIQFISGEVGEGGDHMNLTFKNVSDKSVTISGDTVVVLVSENPKEPDPRVNNDKSNEDAERLKKEKEEAERLRKEKEEAERLQKENEEAERLQKEKEEAERVK